MSATAMQAMLASHSPIDHDRYPAEFLRAIFARTKTIAMVGASTEPWRPSFGIMRYLQANGYRVIPVNPFALGKTLHGESFHANLRDIREPFELVNVFRRAEAIGEVVDDAIAAKAPALWLQLGIRNDAACARAEAAGIAVVMDRCISIEHRRLIR